MATMEVTGMGCDGCEVIVENAVSAVRGVDDVDADHESGVVEYDGDADPVTIAEAINFAGYDVADAEASDGY